MAYRARPLVARCLLALSAVSASASAQDVHYGMNTRVLTAPMADKMTELGAGVVRLAFGWDVIEPNCKGCFDWTTTDAWRDEAKRTHRAIFASLAYAPAWANGGQPYRYPPLNYQDWYDFVFATVSRYRDDIHLWGVWNEPNLDEYLQGADPRVYRSLVITARAAIRAADPLATVLGPDVSWHGVKDGWFAAVMNDFGDLFDIVTVHWYADGPDLAVMMDQLVRPVSLGRQRVDDRSRDEAVRVVLRRGGAGAALSARAERVPGAAQLVDRRDVLRPLRAAVGTRLRHRDHARRLVQPAGVPAVSGVHQAHPSPSASLAELAGRRAAKAERPALL